MLTINASKHVQNEPVRYFEGIGNVAGVDVSAVTVFEWTAQLVLSVRCTPCLQLAYQISVCDIKYMWRYTQIPDNMCRHVKKITELEIKNIRMWPKKPFFCNPLHWNSLYLSFKFCKNQMKYGNCRCTLKSVKKNPITTSFRPKLSLKLPVFEFYCRLSYNWSTVSLQSWPAATHVVILFLIYLLVWVNFAGGREIILGGEKN